MNKYKRLLINALRHARECNELQGEKGYYLTTRITDPTDIKTLRKVASKVKY